MHPKKGNDQFFPGNSSLSVMTDDFMVHFMNPWVFEDDKRYHKAVHLSKLIGIEVFAKYMRPIITKYIQEMNVQIIAEQSIIDLIFKYCL